MDQPPLHVACEPLSGLLGRWVGDGTGGWENVEPFRYREEVIWSHNGKPFLSYTSRTWDPTDARPLHSECGYFRHTGDGRLELICAHPTGIVEISDGVTTDATIELAAISIVSSSSAKPVDDLRRSYLIVGDLITYEIRMATPGVDLRWHLSAELRRA